MNISAADGQREERQRNNRGAARSMGRSSFTGPGRDYYDREKEWRDNISSQLRDLTDKQDDMVEKQNDTNEKVTRIEGQIMSRADIQALVETRVSKDMFDGERVRIWDAVKALQNGPAGIRAWLTVLISALALLVAGLCGGLSLIIQVWPHIH